MSLLQLSVTAREIPVKGTTQAPVRRGIKKKEMRLNDRFKLQEYVPKSVYNEHGDKSVRFISTALINADFQLLQDLEKHYDRPISCSINTWVFGGNRNYSGLRVKGEPYYSEYSMHSFGCASDKIFKFKDNDAPLTTSDVYSFIRLNEAKYYDMGIRRMEDIKDVRTWIHWDTCFTTDAFDGTLQIVGA